VEGDSVPIIVGSLSAPLAFGAIFRHNSGKGRLAMDDFRVGSVPSSEPYGDRHPYGSVARKRQKHRDDEHGSEQDEPADTFEATSNDEDSPAAAGGGVEDYYRPADPVDEEE
jgi:hypothetical protein